MPAFFNEIGISQKEHLKDLSIPYLLNEYWDCESLYRQNIVIYKILHFLHMKTHANLVYILSIPKLLLLSDRFQ